MDFLSTPGALLVFALGFGFLIFVHELGHFLAAKSVGVKCPQFAIGFGQALLSYRKGIGFKTGSTEELFFNKVSQYLKDQGDPLPEDLDESKYRTSEIQNKVEKAAKALGLGETEYRLNWMPLGGYVKMLGQEDMDPNAISDDPRAFNNQPFWPRALIISAGVIMNTIFAFIFFVIAFMSGVSFPPAIIGSVGAGTPAATTPAQQDPSIIGLKPGDVVLEVNGSPPSDFTAISIASALAKPDVPINLLVERHADPNNPDSTTSQYLFPVVPKASEQADGLLQIGISPPLSLTTYAPRDDAQRSLFTERYNIAPGSTLISANNQPITAFHQLQHAIDTATGGSVQVGVTQPDGSSTTITIDTATDLQTESMPSAVKEDTPQIVDHMLGLVPPVLVYQVANDAPATDKLHEGDIIAAIDDLTWPTVPDAVAKVETSEGKELNFRVLRNNQFVNVPLTAQKTGGLVGTYRVGFAPMYATDSNLVAQTLPDSPFNNLNLIPGSRITSIGNTPVANYNQMRLALQNAPPASTPITFTLQSAEARTETTPVNLSEESIATLANLRWLAQDLPPLDELRISQKAESIGQALSLGVQKTHLFIMMTYATLERLIVQRTVGVKHLRGPVGIAQVGTNILLDRGFTYVIFFLGLISINLAVINFLPLPIVDGGLFLLLCLEKIRGKPIPIAVQSAINYAGILFLATIFLIVTFHDITRLFTG